MSTGVKGMLEGFQPVVGTLLIVKLIKVSNSSKVSRMYKGTQGDMSAAS